MCVCPSVRPSAWNNSAPTGWIFMKFYIWDFFLNSFEKIQVWIKYDNNNGYFTWRPCKFMVVSRWILRRMRNVVNKSCGENQNTDFMFSKVCFWKSCLYNTVAQKNVYTLWHEKYADRHNSTLAPASPSLLNTHEISYPHPTPTPLHHTQDAFQSIAAYKFCCQSINLKMAIRAETCSWYLCNKQHISNHQIVVFGSWLIQL